MFIHILKYSYSEYNYIFLVIHFAHKLTIFNKIFWNSASAFHPSTNASQPVLRWSESFVTTWGWKRQEVGVGLRIPKEPLTTVYTTAPAGVVWLPWFGWWAFLCCYWLLQFSSVPVPEATMAEILSMLNLPSITRGSSARVISAGQSVPKRMLSKARTDRGIIIKQGGSTGGKIRSIKIIV